MTHQTRLRRPSWFTLTAVGLATLAVLGASLITAGAGQARERLCRGTPLFGGELDGVTHNQTGGEMKRVRAQAGVGTGFFEPEPAAHIAHGASNRWCVGSHFGIPAMQVVYRLSDGQEVFFDAYSPAVVGGLASGCTITGGPHNMHKFTCTTGEAGKTCIITPAGGGCSVGDVVFTVKRS
jgi:hypothetical protein